MTLAWRGEAVYACQYGAGLVRASLTDGEVEIGQMPCTAVAVDDDGHLLVAASSRDGPGPYGMRMSLYAFDSWRDALAGRPVATYPGVKLRNRERLTVRDGILYSAWHSTDTIDRMRLSTGEALEPVLLEGYDGGILGLSVTADGRMVIPGESSGSSVQVFDAASGALEKSFAPARPVFGAACVGAQ
jgi:hypothetical protein